jgi:hypothetical protein
MSLKGKAWPLLTTSYSLLVLLSRRIEDEMMDEFDSMPGPLTSLAAVRIGFWFVYWYWTCKQRC